MILSTGFTALDEFINGGLNIPSFVVVGGRCGMGKTAFLINLCTNIASLQIAKICYISLDLTAEQIAKRFHKIITFSEDSEKLPSYLTDLEIMDKYLTYEQMIEFIEFKAAEGIKIFFIDYLQLFNQAKENLYEECSYMAVGLKNLCTKLDICIIGASQLSRKVEERTGHRPQLKDLRDSGALEESADIVLLLLRREYYDPCDKPGVAEMIVAKNRNGETGTLNLTYCKEATFFENYIPLSCFRTAEEDEFDEAFRPFTEKNSDKIEFPK